MMGEGGCCKHVGKTFELHDKNVLSGVKVRETTPLTTRDKNISLNTRRYTVFRVLRIE